MSTAIPSTPFVAYKATRGNKTGHNYFLFEEGKTYTHPRKPEICRDGYHFCLNPISTLRYYSGTNDLLWEVEVLGEVVGDPRDKLCTDKIRMIRILGEEERKKLLTGTTTSYHQNGQKRKEECTYKDGKLDGPSIEWYENGQKRGESTYRDGELDGPLTTWHANGQKWTEKTFKDGNII